tara:strand:- start:2 stop:646 length:645 start_codon:yes stop_codon:yes gene_type:complete
MLKIYLISFLAFLLLISYKLGIFFFPINEIDIISGERKYNEHTIHKYIDSLHEKNLLTINIDEIKKNILTDNWIEDAQITKSFPSTLIIKIIQYKPIAIYNSILMATDGTTIRSSTIPSNLPIIIDHSNDRLLANKIFLMTVMNLNSLNLDIKKIEIFHSLIKIYTPTIIFISDRDKYEVNMNRLILSFDKLQEAFGKKISSIDMRYSNGFAIK